MEPMLCAALPDISSVCKEFRLGSHVWGMSVGVCLCNQGHIWSTRQRTNQQRESEGWSGCEPTHMVGSGEAINREELDMGLRGCTRFLLVD